MDKSRPGAHEVPEMFLNTHVLNPPGRLIHPGLGQDNRFGVRRGGGPKDRQRFKGGKGKGSGKQTSLKPCF